MKARKPGRMVIHKRLKIDFLSGLFGSQRVSLGLIDAKFATESALLDLCCPTAVPEECWLELSCLSLSQVEARETPVCRNLAVPS